MTTPPASVEISETFVSLQGESTHSGQPCWFVRLSGCNLRCRYCDTARAWERGERRAVAGLVDEYRASGVALAEITGGEPLLQPGFPALAAALRDAGPGPLLVETNGACDLRLVPAGAIAIMDIKTPGSGESERFDRDGDRRLGYVSARSALELGEHDDGSRLTYEDFAASGVTPSQMCFGTIGTAAASMSALGLEQTIFTVVGSTASTWSMPAVSIVKFHSLPWMM